MGSIYLSDYDSFNNIKNYDSIDVIIKDDNGNTILNKTNVRPSDIDKIDFSFYIDDNWNILRDELSYYGAIRVNSNDITTDWVNIKEDKQRIVWYYRKNNKYDYRQGKYRYLLEVYDIDDNLVINHTYNKDDKTLDVTKTFPVINLDFNNVFDINKLEHVYTKIDKTLYVKDIHDITPSKLTLKTIVNPNTNIHYSSMLNYTTFNSTKYNYLELEINKKEINGNRFVLKLGDVDLQIENNNIYLNVNNNTININCPMDEFILSLYVNNGQTNLYYNYKLEDIVLTELDINNITFYIDNIKNTTSKCTIDWIRYYQL